MFSHCTHGEVADILIRLSCVIIVVFCVFFVSEMAGDYWTR